MKKIVIVLLVCTILLSLCGCKRTEGITNTLQNFGQACRDLDLNAMLNCVDPTIAKPIQFGLALYGVVADSDVQDTLDDLVGLVFGEDYRSSEFLSTLQFSDFHLSGHGSSAKVNCKVSFELSGQSFTREATITLVEKDDTWYISKISFAK